MNKRLLGVLSAMLLGIGCLSANAEGEIHVTPTDPKPISLYTFNDAAEKDFFWGEDYATTTVENGTLKVSGPGKNWGVVLGSSADKIQFDAGKDYTVMLRYKTHKMTPEYQFVVFGSKGGKEYSDYCYRWSTADFTNHWSYQREPSTGNEYQWAGDFQYVKDGDYTVVSFHFYTAPDLSGIYFKLGTCEFQEPKPLEFTLDSLRIFEGYADLSKPADLLTDSPVQPKPTATTQEALETTIPTSEATDSTASSATTAPASSADTTTTAAATTTLAAPTTGTDVVTGNESSSDFPIGLIVCITAAIVVAGLGIGGYFFFTRKKPQA